MNPAPFPQSNRVLKGFEPNPSGMPMGDLHTHVLPDWVISKWSMSWRERLSALFFGTVWLRVMTSQGTHCPVSLHATREIFNQPREKMPRRFHRAARREPRYDAVVFGKHQMFVPQYPHLGERCLMEGEYFGHFLTAYDGALYHAREERLLDEIAHEQKWTPWRQRGWFTFDEADAMLEAMETRAAEDRAASKR